MSRCKRARRLGAREAAHSCFEEDGLALLGRGGGGHRASSALGPSGAAVTRCSCSVSWGARARLFAGPEPKGGCGKLWKSGRGPGRPTSTANSKFIDPSLSRASGKALASRNSERACSRLSILRFATGPKRSIGHLLRAEKINFFNSRPRAPYGLWRPRRLNPVNPWS